MTDLTQPPAPDGPTRPVALIVLAAGAGTRMNSDLPKPLHELGGRTLLAHALEAGRALAPEHVIVVTGHRAEAVETAVASEDETAICVRQEEQKGTGHAVLQAAAALEGFEGDAVVLYADTPFLSPRTLERLRAARADHDVVVLGFETEEPGRYGRLVMDGNALTKIVEFKDATPGELAITFCNSGVMAADAATLMAHLGRLRPQNAAGEYYLTDVVEVARAAGGSAGAVLCPQDETLGVDSRAGLAQAEARFQALARTRAMENGVTLVWPDSVVFSADTVIGRDAVVEPHVVFGPGVTIETGARIRAFSHLEGCHVSSGAVVGPYARLRPDAEIGNDAKIGNFVEVKAATIGEGAKVNHLSYIGDAEIGTGTNVGAGTVTCNYDGVMKHRTVIGRDVFIGSDTMLVAPVTIGDAAMTASGSVITQDVPAGALALGRARQVNKPGLARRLMDRLRALKNEKKS
jgi:bifunctional UDP-N-acetylglucosamine pyrophosphorylase/glucosamine-1-phosphate N-acetyltransferase